MLTIIKNEWLAYNSQNVILNNFEEYYKLMRKDMLRAGQSRGSIVCVNGVMHYKS